MHHYSQYVDEQALADAAERVDSVIEMYAALDKGVQPGARPASRLVPAF